MGHGRHFLTIGNESPNQDSSDNGVRIVNFATSKNLVVKSTLFPHRNIHTYTWTSPDGQTLNQIDHILIDRRWHPSILASVTYAIRSLKHTLPKETFKISIYLSQAESIITYWIIFWGQSSEASKVFIMQKKMLRIIYNLKTTDTCRNIFTQNHIMTFYSCYICSLILFVFNNRNLFDLNTHIH
jgi:hypothetical protein